MSSILEKIEVHLRTHRMQAWEGTFRDYLSLVLRQPALAQRAHTRLFTKFSLGNPVSKLGGKKGVCDGYDI